MEALENIHLLNLSVVTLGAILDVRCQTARNSTTGVSIIPSYFKHPLHDLHVQRHLGLVASRGQHRPGHGESRHGEGGLHFHRLRAHIELDDDLLVEGEQRAVLVCGTAQSEIMISSANCPLLKFTPIFHLSLGTGQGDETTDNPSKFKCVFADRPPRPPPSRRWRTVSQGAAPPWWCRDGTTSSRPQSPLTDNGLIICQNVTQGKVRDVA